MITVCAGTSAVQW